MIGLREFLSIEDSGLKPVRVSGSRWITHKWNAMKESSLSTALILTTLLHFQ